MSDDGRPPRARSLRLALGGAVLWMLAGAALMPMMNDDIVVVKVWCGFLGAVAIGTLGLSIAEAKEAPTRPAGIAGIVAALVLGGASVLLWFMAAPWP